MPKLTDERRNNLYDRANHFRRNNEFDKAASIYEQLLNEDTTDAEAYWSLVLCRYGIEYVEDPSSHKRLPTINRAQFTSIFADENYKSALQYADSNQKLLYEEEAVVIDNIQKGILAISEKEAPFDVFICYKETDANGRRTRDSVLATELYQELTREGLKTFFARVTLDDKLGEAYEPYIFAALNSAKVMVVVGTKPEHLQAVWVRNEWSRFLGLIKAGARKTLIPAYKDMDPYDMPEEFSHLQALDMTKLGFMQDLIRGIKKLTAAEEKNTAVVHETTVVNTSFNANSNALIDRAMMACEDGEFEKADDFAEQALNQDARNPLAYVAKLMAELKVKTRKGLGKLKQSFEDNGNYKKAVRFGDDSLKNELIGYLNEIDFNFKTAMYVEACKFMSDAECACDDECACYDNWNAISLFRSIKDFKDSEAKIHECELNIDQIKSAQEEKRKLGIYSEACKLMNSDEIASNEQAIELFKSVIDYRDSSLKIQECEQNIDQIKSAQEEKRKLGIYSEACKLMNSDEIASNEQAIELFKSVIDYRDSSLKIQECEQNIVSIKERLAAESQKGLFIIAVYIFVMLGLALLQTK